jgi:hypothetical protein
VQEIRICHGVDVTAETFTSVTTFLGESLIFQNGILKIREFSQSNFEREEYYHVCILCVLVLDDLVKFP